MICDGCGAPYRDTEPRCPFCGRLREEARDQQADERARAESKADSEQARLRAAAQTTVERCAKHSLYWALGGLPFCFVPIGAIVAIILAMRAKLLAKQHGLIAPARATVGLSVAALQLLAGAAVMVFANQQSAEHEARVKALSDELGQRAQQPALTAATACRIAELHLLTEGHDGIDDINIERVRCPGKLTTAGDTAVLDNVRFNKRRCQVTLRYGTAWDVESVSGREDCIRAKPNPQGTENTDTKDAADSAP